MSRLHASDVVHGDIRPSNILLSDDKPRQIRLVRPAGHSVGHPSLQLGGHFKGTSVYAAPERLQQRFLDDADSDDEGER